MAKKKHYHRGRRKKRKVTFGKIIYGIVFALAIGVFCYCGFQLVSIFAGYHEGKKEYDSIAEQVVSIENSEDRFAVDFDKLYEMNEDVVGWIRFEEPAVINYPIVYGTDNDEYLHKTFQGYDNTVGSIFVNAYNSPTFEDPCTIVYGHRMNNGTMFNKLGEYEEKSFWEKYPFFYIYEPDNTEMKYQIYSVGIVNETSELYSKYLKTGEKFEDYIALSRECSFYETGVEVTKDDKIVLLSTCTNDNEEERLIVLGVRVGEKELEE